MAAITGITPFRPRLRVETETVTYLGYEIEVCNRDCLVFAPNGDVACYRSMTRARRWIRRHRRESHANG